MKTKQEYFEKFWESDNNSGHEFISILTDYEKELKRLQNNAISTYCVDCDIAGIEIDMVEVKKIVENITID